jgi:hypothetical protein
MGKRRKKKSQKKDSMDLIIAFVRRLLGKGKCEGRDVVYL